MGGERHRAESRGRSRAAARVSDEVVRAPDGSAAAQSETGYALLDAGEGERLERWGPYRLRRPDARAAGLARRLPAEAWRQADAWYRGEAGSGAWSCRDAMPDRWLVTHGEVTFTVKLAPYKHTGVFPEQAAHWRWMRMAVAQAMGARGSESPAAEAQTHPSAGQAHRPLRVLNLFAYTGGATIALAKAGCLVTHVDASKPALAWAKENARANRLPADAIRWIEDDAAAFVARELRRGRIYDAVLLDPPSFGRAPKGRTAGGAAGGGMWRLHDHLPALLADVRRLLPDPLFVLINDYARDADATALARLLHQTMRAGAAGAGAKASGTALAPQADASAAARASAPAGAIEAGRLSLATVDGRCLETGVFARWRAAR